MCNVFNPPLTFKADALKILKIFDKNDNGVIDVSEFYEAFGPTFYQEGLRIITKRSA
jgi:Ca2+-binding EF-hand superfamily protein